MAGMLKTLSLILLLILIESVVGQNSYQTFLFSNGFSIKVGIEEPKYSENKVGRFIIRDYYEFTDESRPNTFTLPNKFYLIAIPPNSHPSLEVLEPKSENINGVVPSLNPTISLENDSSLTTKQNYDYSIVKNEKKNIVEVLGYMWYRGLYCMCIGINTHSFDSELIRITRLTEIEIKLTFDHQLELKNISNNESNNKFANNIVLNSEIAEQFRSDLNNTVKLSKKGNWIDYESNFLKIGIAEDGMFRIVPDDFAKLGVNLDPINPKTFRLFESGIEKPIFVHGEFDNKFDNSDYIEFYATKNYSKISPRVLNKDDEPYNEFMDIYTDTTIFFLEWGSQKGKRVEIDSTLNNNIQDTLKYYDEFIHLEKNPIDALFYTFRDDITQSQLPFWDTGKSWYWSFLMGTAIFKYNFPMSDLVANQSANFFCKVVSRGSNVINNAHLYNLKINSVAIDTQNANRFQRSLLAGKVQSQFLKEGTNIIEINAQNNNGGTTGQPLLDWFEIEYPRKLIAKNDTLSFEIRNDLVTKVRLIKISGLTGDSFEVYRVKPTIKKFISYRKENNSIVFSDTSGHNFAWYVSAVNKIKKPNLVKKKVFVNLRNKTDQTDYLAVTHDKFINAVKDYTSFIEQAYNVKTETISVEDIFDEFGYGYPNPKAVKDFIKFKMDNSKLPLPYYLVLFGDANYDYKHYRFLQSGVKGGGNYVPSYGFPNSDYWYAIFDSLGVSLPQLAVGRIPINSIEDLKHYFGIVQNNFETPFDSWNKRFLFFSGGQNNNPSEISMLKSVNDKIIKDIIVPPPLSGEYIHFYKTEKSDLGPYSSTFIHDAIERSGVLISYVGHSGTATWDNSISDVNQLENKVNRNPLISDFGCSTNKFAEPDIVCFGERFILDPRGQAIGYVGNSSLGFTSIATTAPEIFFTNILNKPTSSIGYIHVKSKEGIFSRFGSSNITKIYNYQNVLLGDPIITVKIPVKPNIGIRSQDIINQTDLSDLRDTATFKVSIRNYGIQVNKNFIVKFSHLYNNSIISEKSFVIPVPANSDTITYKVDIFKKPGIHKLKIILDADNGIDEIYENDNQIEYEFNVVSSDIRDLLLSQKENGLMSQLIVLSPSAKVKSDSKIYLQKGIKTDLNNSSIEYLTLDSFYTKLSMKSSGKERIWFRYGIGSNNTTWSLPKSFHPNSNASIFLGDSISFANQRLTNLIYEKGNLTTITDSVSITVISAGQFAGGNCLIMRNGQNLLGNTFFQGIGVGVFNINTLVPDTLVWFNLFNNSQGISALTDFLKSIPNNKLVTMGVAWDAINNMSTQLRNAIKLIGSKKIDSLQYKGSWAFIGVKGGNIWENIEEVKGPYDGILNISKNFLIQHPEGYLTTKPIGPVGRWKNINLTKIDKTSKDIITCTPIGFKTDNIIDTLKQITLDEEANDVRYLNTLLYPKIQFRFSLKGGNNQKPSGIQSIALDFIGVPELGTNYQVVSISKDSLDQGEKANLNFSVYNVGESTASNFNVRVDLVKKDNSKERLFEQLIDSIQTEKKKDFSLSYTTDKLTGSNQFQITIDTENAITELYKDNNFYAVPFYVQPNNKPASLKLTIDGADIINGDFISSKPNFKIELNDESLIPITDTTKILLYLNNKRIYFSNYSGVLNYSYSSSNPKMIVNYTPTLTDGEYTLRVIGKNATDQIIDSTGIVRKFTVKEELQLLNAYNYPNPFKDDTYFTFKLTQIPDELKIIIYTIAGRKIKEIKLNGSELKYDFNRIFWDGRDQDGDIAANGVYLYKIISQKGDEKTEVTEKLAIIR